MLPRRSRRPSATSRPEPKFISSGLPLLPIKSRCGAFRQGRRKRQTADQKGGPAASRSNSTLWPLMFCDSSRNKLSEDFVAALYNDFQEHGSAAIAACRAEKPDVYIRVIAGILPKDMT